MRRVRGSTPSSRRSELHLSAADSGDACVVLCTAPTVEAAERLARAVVEERLAACVNLVGPVRSIYRWNDAVCDEAEHLLVIKTAAACVPDLTARLVALHAYTCPEVVALPIASGHAPYLAWLLGETRP